MDVWAEEFEEDQVGWAGILDGDGLNGSVMSDEQLLQVKIPCSDFQSIKKPRSLPGEEVIDAGILADVLRAGFDNQFLAAKFGGVVKYPVLLHAWL